MAASVMGALLHEPSDTTPSELREQIDVLSWQEPLIHSHPHLIQTTAPNKIRSLMEVWHKSSNLNQTHLKDFMLAPNKFSIGASNNSFLNHHVVKSTGIPWAYTFGRATDGSAWVFLYQQKLSEGNYFRDRLYYNKLGEILCKRMGIVYLGSDSGIFQRKETFDMLLNVYDLSIKKKLDETFEFDRRYHHAGRKELIRTKSGFEYRHGIDVGNGQGLQYIGHGENLKNVAQLLSGKTKFTSAGAPSAQPGSVSDQSPDHPSQQKKSIQAIKKTTHRNPSGLPTVLDIPHIDKKYLLSPDYIIHVV
jgi:hypothetical protein